ncbi:hypothetical protein [Wenyingzhuangia sp. 2_MG-2023]|uniref:hypothetical protein n=1 Tax=Wenyingzhuangia sp. 2_MG-2023 TaxID=3062639 RepID=UPI0026E328E8|nr:hypothetical protein [Wenyingzhuangia sp. 2_MG-2023]MDO6739482.1 hypothetical protein [Wenyingzhuangia sp. 2_MG-2023]
MKKNIYILFFIFITSNINCQNKSDRIKSVSDFFNHQVSEKKLVAEIDFSKSESTLVKDIEKQLNIDLCDNSSFIGKINFNNVEINFPAFVMKNCKRERANLHNIISIYINQKNEILVNEKIIESTKNIESEVLKITKNKILGTSRKSLIYLIKWNNHSTPIQTKKIFFEILLAIRSYSNELAEKIYNKDISELSEKELSELNKKFTGNICFVDYFKPIPIPPMPTKQ